MHKKDNKKAQSTQKRKQEYKQNINIKNIKNINSVIIK
jgi:hypothetical protein